MSFSYITQALATRRAEGLFRQRVLVEHACASRITVAGEQYLNFASNDYLGLATQLDATQLVSIEAGSRSSALVTGYLGVHQQLERQLCDALGYEAALLFPSGFAANTSTLKALFTSGEKQFSAAVFQDKLNHASLIDGGLAGNAKFVRFNHNDLNHLRSRLEKTKANNKLIVTEGVFSMDGDTAPIVEISKLAQSHSSWLMVDDAHAFGVIGENGLGTVDTGIKPEILVVTFGKAMGCQGAAVLASRQVIEYLVQFNREFVYTTALSPIMASVALHQLNRLLLATEPRDKLSRNIAYFKKLISATKLSPIPSDTAIQPLVFGTSENVIAAQNKLKQKGIWVGAIRPPTVPHNTARLRITITAEHSTQDIEYLVSALVEVS
ncbi:aminotransferase class I/II-fold pyridoxal phosphate-dependent enzyme [Pseudoalteromonas peptidolytica]|uniref:aminotransferase class I/II-fold pyridoxal phosphate-dependent enzyme n=1 Tax=Pseudoalteromonas peptidolytica TaxID=61150 RepID=UPI00298E1B06|nr:8-amino-7-oxononanoate synthase [Pseudoalteromonas peptidolytica]MDW7550522.1 8-amino-7-oxononanoate synthase [Pseudoalteromonas peptidolytica]